MVFPFNWPGQDQEQLGKNANGIFAEPFSWLKPIGDWVGGIPNALREAELDQRTRNDWDNLGKIGVQKGGDLGQLTYNAPRRDSAPLSRSGGSGGIDHALAALKGAYNSPSQMGQEGTPPMLQRPEERDEVLAEYEARATKIKALMDELEMGTDNQALVDEAFAGSLAAIQKARDSAAGNFQESDAAIQGLTQGHVNEIKTVDRRAVEDNAQQFSGELTNTYDTAKNTIAADQKAELSAREEMLKRLGIQEAGLGNAGQEQSAAIGRLSEGKAQQLGRASTYKAADLTRNTEQAAAQATEGVERRSDLRRQLDGINADLDRDTASVENSKAQARIAGTNADKEAYLKQLQFYSDELEAIEDAKTSREDKQYDRAFAEREFNAKNAPGNNGSAYDVAATQVMNKGHDPGEYKQAFAEVMEENSYDSRSGKDKISHIVHNMRKKNSRLDPQVALEYASLIVNGGTDKANTPLG